MADVFEDFPPEDNDLLNYMDSGNVAADDDHDEESDYETRLYSLVHYSEDDAFKAGDVISNSDTLLHVSKGTKVSRLNPVRNIIATADDSSSFDDKRSRSTHNQNKFNVSENDLRSLLYAYKNSASLFSHSTPIRKNYNQNTTLVSALNQSSDPSILSETSKNNCLEIDDLNASAYINITSNNESVSCEIISDCSFKGNTDDVESKAEKLNCKNNLENSAGSSRRHITHDDDIGRNCIGNNRILSKSNQQLSRRKRYKSRVSIIQVDEEVTSSKYNMELNKGKKNTTSRDSDGVTSKYTVQSRKNDLSDSVIVLDDSDSNSSILEMQAPVKEPPPIVVLSSEDEDEAVDKTEVEDIVVLYSGGEKHGSVSSSGNGQLNEGRLLQEKPNKEKKKKRKKKKKTKSSSFASKGTSPSSWTEKMSRFYNDSWGGEDFDVKKLQSTMSGKRSKWHLLGSDFDRMNGHRDIKCQKCNNYGHRARFCTESPKPIVCLFCGIEGHVQTRCPTAICLRCGKPSLVYNFGCHVCSVNRNSNNNNRCSVCKLFGHHATDCPETWRRYHSTTTEEDLSNQIRTLYKPCDQQHCSNCTLRGHQYHECNISTQQGNWQKRANSSFSEQNKHAAKRRKLDMNNSQMRYLPKNSRRNNIHPFLSYFVPRNRYM